MRLRDIELDASDFETIGEGFERATGRVRRGRVAGAEALLISQRAPVDYAVRWMEETR